jgi:exonuclease III
MDLMQHYKMVSWNVHGLNSTAKQEDVRQCLTSCKPDLICLQETKLACISSANVRSIMGSGFDDNFVFLPATGIRGGILIVAQNSVFHLSQPVLTANTISVTVEDCRRNAVWTVIGVYGPQEEFDKKCSSKSLKDSRGQSSHNGCC